MYALTSSPECTCLGSPLMQRIELTYVPFVLLSVMNTAGVVVPADSGAFVLMIQCLPLMWGFSMTTSQVFDLPNRYCCLGYASSIVLVPPTSSAHYSKMSAGSGRTSHNLDTNNKSTFNLLPSVDNGTNFPQILGSFGGSISPKAWDCGMVASS